MILGPDEALKKYRRKGLLLDANLLLLLVVGRIDAQQIGKRKLSQYREEDWMILAKFVESFGSRLISTAHVLTEVSNLLSDWPLDSARARLFDSFKKMIEIVNEVPGDSGAASARAEFPFLGLTDCVLAQLTDSYLVLSDDARMVVKLNEAGLNAINFTYFREDLQRIVS